MLFGSVTTVEGFRRFLNSKTRNYAQMVEQYRKEAEADVKYGEENSTITYHNQARWLAWHSIDLAAQSVAADEAARLLHLLHKLEEDAAIPEGIKAEALRNILADMRLNSRSSLASSNLAEDAKRAFWTEVGSILLTK